MSKAEYFKRRYHTDSAYRQKQLENRKKNAQKKRGYIKEVVAEFRRKGCAICREMEPCCLSAHHIDPSEKEFTIGEAMKISCSIDMLKAELLKCVCLCHNCHSKVHAGVTRIDSSSS